eukprot:TRINITY_DN2224_c0_g2_i2.p1 TRINITY_DN2224_c0_g2~~TRINITY_DN2224_c0_g2_i2.p1  ORF type:complete len:314 (+),score=94.71 TRINITY_DN2224_c0_g2_i2:224-1165(+)
MLAVPLAAAAAAAAAALGRAVWPGLDDHIIDNGVIRLGVDVTRGGSIGYVADVANPEHNVVNCHDLGREVQLSFYAGPDKYDPATPAYPDGACNDLFMARPWPWNPIGAGDIDHNPSEVLEVTRLSNASLRVRTRPLQWACHNVSCECEFEQVIELDGTGAKVTATLHNRRTDSYDASVPHSQELPAVYTVGSLDRLVTYNGSAPWTGAALSEYATSGPPWVPGRFPATENWAAFVNTGGWGLGVVSPDLTTFLGGFNGFHGGNPGPYDSATGYIAPVKEVALPKNGAYTFTFYLVLGNLPDIRAYAQGKAYP